MMTRQTEAQLAFEAFVEKNLQAAVNYAGGNPSIRSDLALHDP